MASISEIMTKELKTVSTLDLVTAVSDLFEQNDFHHIPVVDDQSRLEGIISRHDFNLLCDKSTLFNERSELINDRVFQSLIVKDIMTPRVVTVTSDEPISKAAHIMRENLFHAIPVVDQDQFLVGIVTTYDLLSYAFP